MPSPPLCYLRNVGWLLVPVFVWNAALFSRLPSPFSPAVFWCDIPGFLSATENGLRVVIFALPFFAPFERSVRPPKAGLALDGVGMAVYLASWLPLIAVRDSPWWHSAVGFLTLALTIGEELGLAMALQSRPLAEYLASRDKVSGPVYLFPLLAFALLPRLRLPNRD
jgi:hypothetical protein